MTTGFFQFFNNKAQQADSRDASTKKARNGRVRSALKPRRLLTEALEERQLLAVGAFGASEALLATEATATVVNITSDNFSIDSIKEAIKAAASTPEDEIIRVPSGTLEFTTAADVIEIDYDAASYGSITLEAVGGDLTFDANGYNRVFTIKNGDVTLQSINVVEGLADYGGAIANGGTLALKDVELQGNAASAAGGAIANKGVLTIQDSVITNNVSSGDGAAIYEGDFAWPQVTKPEWTAQIADQVGLKGQTIDIDLSEYCSEGPWTFSFECSNPNAAIFAAQPTLSNGVLKLSFLSEDQYEQADDPSMLDLSAVEFTVVASDGTNTASQSFNVAHKSQAAISIGAVLSNMTFDDVDENYAVIFRKKLQGYCCEDGIPESEIVDLTDEELYVQVWGCDNCYGYAEKEVAWDCGDFVTTGYVIVLQLTNAEVVESYLPETFCRSGDKITTEDCGNGKYIIYPAYTSGAPFGYTDDALLLDMLKIRAIDPTQPVSVETFQYSTDSSLPSAMRMYGATPSKVDPSQIEYSGAISTSTEPYAVHMGETFDSAAASAVADESIVLKSAAAAAYSTTISNSLIANNVATGRGVVYVASEGELAVYNATIANNTAKGAALYVSGTAFVGNSIVVNADLSPIYGSVSGSNNLINANVESSVEYDSTKPLFSDAGQGDYTLATDSQAANIGSNDYAIDVDGAPLTLDLAGSDRICGVTVDSGAYEYIGVAPAVPTNVVVSDYVESSKNPTISWTAPASQDGVSGYYVYYGTNETPIATVEGLELKDLASYVTLNDNNTYKFGVSAFNAYGESPKTIVTLDTTVAPSAPKNVKFGPYADHSAKLTWTNVDNATSYKVVMTNTATGATSEFTTTTNSYTFSNLEDFTKYSCVVSAVNSRGEKAASAVALDTTVAPSAPTNLVASAYTGDHTTTLTWNAVDHAVGYKIAKFDGSSWIVVGSADTTSFTIEGLADNATYEYGVAAYAVKDGSELISGYTDVTFSTIVAPAAPTDLEWVGAYAGNTATLQWAASEGAVGYRVAKNVGGEWVVVGTTDKLQYAITGLTDNQEYVFGVSAYSERGTEKLYSDYASIDLNTIVAPAKATNPRFSPYEGGNTAVLTWTASVGGATGYSVQQLDGTKWVEVANVSGTSCEVAVEENSFYTFQVVAYNTVGEQTVQGEASDAVNLDTLVVPTGDIEVTVDGYDHTDGSADLTWTNLEHASSYTIEQKVVGESDYTIVAAGVAAVEGDVMTYELSGLAAHTTYQFRVTAANAKGTGSSGESAEFYTFAPPTKPVASYVYDSTNASATISYSSDYATSYVVADSEGQVLYEGAAGSYVATGLAENQTYLFYVTAKNDVGSSETTEVSVYTAAVPQAPTGVVWGAYSNHSATLSWNDVEAEDGYRVYQLSDGGWELVATTAANVTEHVFAGLNDYSTYTVCVVAFNEVGESAKSASVVLDTTVAPSAPTNLKFTFGEYATYQGDGKATLQWKAVDHADGYRVQVKVDGAWTTVKSVASNSCELTDLVNYTTYEYRVAAYATRGTEKLYSSNTVATLVTDWIPTGEINLTVGEYDAASKTADLTWTAATAATSYKIDQLIDGAWKNVGSTAATTYTLALADNTNYVYRVVATNSVGDGSSDQVEFFTAAAPAQPTASTSYDSQKKEGTISFHSDFAVSYTVTDGEGNVVYTGAQESCVVKDLADNTEYVFNIVASNEQGDSPVKQVTLYTAAVPAAPTGLKFSAYADNASTLSWNPVDSATSGYRVYMQTVDGEWTQIGITIEPNVSLTGLSDYSIYTFSVTACNSEGESAKSAPAVLDTTVAPAAPNVSVSYGEKETYQGDGKATLTWDAVDHASSYEVVAYADGKWTVVATTADLSFNVEGLENFSKYEYGVASIAMRGDEVLKSDYTTVQIDTAWVPTEEIIVSVGEYDYVNDVAELTWSAVEHAEGYRVEQSVDGGWKVVDRTVNLHDTLRLKDNTQYTFRVVAYNNVGDGSTASVEFFTFAPPAAPSDAAFGEFVAETGKATMTWTDVPYAEWYEIGTYVGEEMVVEQSDVASFTATDLVEDMVYTYYVRACNHIGATSVEGFSDWVEVELDTHQASAPAAPSELAVSEYDEASKTATLTWKDNSRNEEWFTLQSSLDGVTWSDYAKLDANATSVKTSALQPGTTYYFRIAAANVYGQSDWATVEYTTPTGIPAAPSDVTFGQYDQEARSFEMRWVNNADNALYFTLSYSPNGQDWYDSRDVRADVTSYEWVGLTEGQTYQFRVCAWNANGVSEYAYGTYEVPYHGKTRPAAPSDIDFGAYDYDSNAVQMTWKDNSDNEDGFYVQFSFDGESWRSAGTTKADVSSRLACNMIPGREYYFRVASYNVAGYSDWTYGEFTADVTLAAPTDFVFGEYSNGRLETSWSYDGKLDSETGGFVVQYSYDNENWQRAGHTAYDVTERIATGVAPGRTYYFRVAAYSDSVYSDWLYSGAYTAPTGVPAAPAELTFSEGSTTSVKLTWTDQTDIEVGYNVQYSLDGETWISAGNTSANIVTKTVTSLRSGVEYQFRVRAYNYYGASEWTTGAFTTEQAVDAPNAPTDVVLSDYNASTKTMKMAWKDNATNESGFTVQYTYDGGKTWYISGSYGANVETRTATGLVAGRTYQFRVCAFNENGASDWAYSEEFYVSASEYVPAAPTGLSAALDGKTAQLAWTDAATNETGYRVECKAGNGDWAVVANLAAGSTSYTTAKLNASTTYAFRVYAYNSYGSSSASNEAVVDVPADEFQAPAIEAFNYASKPRTLEISWSEVAKSTYTLQYSLDQANWYGVGVGKDATSATLSGVTYGKTYYFRVQAVAEDATSDWTYGWYNTQTGESSVSNEAEDVSAALLEDLFSGDVVDSFFDELN